MIAQPADDSNPSGLTLDYLVMECVEGAPHRWRSDGRELFCFVPQADNISRVMAFDVRTTASAFEAAAPRELFNMGRLGGPHSSGANYWSYAVSPDCQQFVTARSADNPAQTQESPIAVVLNWAAARKK